ncbi:hypothetical protein ACEPAG_4056 [Sanghuangporus baumii]
MTVANGNIDYTQPLATLLKVVTTAAQEQAEYSLERLRECLVASLKGHVSKLGDETERLKKELQKEEEEEKITSEDIHEGFESHYAPPIPEPEPVKGAHQHGKKKIETKTTFEVINPKGVEHAQVAALASQSAPTGPSSSSSAAAAKEDDEDEEVPEMTPSLEAFSHFPLRGYEESFHFIQEHRDVYVPGASDALLVAGFRAEREGKHGYAKQCERQALQIQYCEQLGTDGVRLFFKRMTARDPRAKRVFQTDVENTYNHVKSRVEATRAEMDGGAGEEQIQLVAEGDGTQISSIIPDEPPPEHLELEGPGTENLDIEQVRRVLQMRWDVFNDFRDDVKEALKSQKLEQVNKVLASMSVEEAEKVVQLLDQSGILSFTEGGIRDETGRNKAADDEEGIEDVPELGDEADVEEVKSAAI